MAESSGAIQRTVSSWWSWIRGQHQQQQHRLVKQPVKVKRRRRFLLSAVSMFDVGTQREHVTSAAADGFASSCLALDESPAKRRPTSAAAAARRRDTARSCYELDGETRAYCETHFPALPFDTIDQSSVVQTDALSWQPRDRCTVGAVAEPGATLDGDGQAGDGERRSEAMTCNEPQTKQLCALDLLAASLHHIDSDDDDEQPSAKLVLTSNEREALYNLANKPSNKRQSIILGNKMTEAVSTPPPPPPPPLTPQDHRIVGVDKLSPSVMDCGVYLPGCRHRGRALAVVELAALQDRAPTLTALAQLLAYYHTVPRKSAAKHGLIVLVVGAPDRYPRAFNLIEQLVACHDHDLQRKCIDDVVIWGEGSISQAPVRLATRSCDVMSSTGELRERLAGALPLSCCGGPLVHNQHDWIAFRKIVEPFLNSCRQRSKILGQVIGSVRTQMATVPEHGQIPRALTELDALYKTSSTDAELVALLGEGPRTLQDVAIAKAKLGDNVDARETMERCSALYAEVQRSVGRLARVCERRKAQLERRLAASSSSSPDAKQHEMDDHEPGARCRQILSWLCRKGEETLSRYHVTPPDSLAAAKAQQREFQRFLTLAQKQIVKGKELLQELQRDSGKELLVDDGATLPTLPTLDETPAAGSPASSRSSTRCSSYSSASIHDLASSLQTQLSKFGHRLDDTRERLEDTSRCYELLDKAYEWGVEAMKLASKLKLDQQPCPPSVAAHLLNQVDQFLLTADETSNTAVLEDLNALARKLDNPKLLDQCKLAQNRCQETLELLEFRRKTLAEYVREEEIKRQQHQQQQHHHQQQQQQQQQQLLQQQQQSNEPAENIYENVSELTGKTSGEDKVDGLGGTKEFQVWKAADEGSACAAAAAAVQTAPQIEPSSSSHCVLLRVKKATSADSSQTAPMRGSASYSSGTSSSSYSSNSWGSRMKLAMQRKLSSGDGPAIDEPPVLIDKSDSNKDNKLAITAITTREETEEEEEHSEEVSVCQSPISVNSHLQCRASSMDLSLPIAAMQEAGLTPEDIKSQKTLLLIMREMIQTERDYVRSLEYIIENYIPELSREDIPQALRGKRNVIFGNIEKIYGFHSHYFLRELEHCHSMPFLVGQCFLRHEQHFYLYALYNKNKPKSDALMAEYGTAFFRRKQMELGDKMDLASYLLKPVQRMGKYALLLKQLLKESGEKEPEHADLMAAEQMVRFQLRHGNDLLAMDSLRDCDVNVKEQGRLLRQSEFYCWQGRKKGLRHVFLFEELILFSKAKRDPERKNLDIYIYKHSMKTSDIGFTAKMGESSTRFEIWFRKRKPNDTIILEATNPDVKEAWVEDISRILWKQALRNRELRMAEMAEMGIGNKPCLDIRPSQDQISDRSISYAQLAKAPKFRHSVCGSILSDSRSSKRPHSIISVSSSASSSASSGSGSNDNRTTSSSGQDTTSTNNLMANLHNHRSKTNQSQCSAESGILADLSMSYDDATESGGHCRIGRSDSSITTESVDSVTLSPSSPVTSSKSCPAYTSMTPVSLYVNNKLIPITPSPSHKPLPMTEM